MFCNKCGASNPDNAIFCCACGAKLEAVQSEDENKIDYESLSNEELERRVELNDAEAMIQLACNYLNNDEDKYSKKIFELFSKSAELSNIDALYNVGCCYLYGVGVERDLILAKQYLTDAVNNSNLSNDIVFSAYQMLAECYEELGEDALPYWEKAWQKSSFADDDISGKFGVCSSLAFAYDDAAYEADNNVSKVSQAKTMLEKARNLYNSLDSNTKETFTDIYANILKRLACRETDDYKKINGLKSALEVEGVSDYGKGEIYCSLGRAYLDLYGDDYSKGEREAAPYFRKSYEYGSVSGALFYASFILEPGSAAQSKVFEFAWNNGPDWVKEAVQKYYRDNQEEIEDNSNGSSFWSIVGAGVAGMVGSSVARSMGASKEFSQGFGSGLAQGVYNQKERDSSCFITTAVCQSLNAADDCPELMSIRDFRDSFVKNTNDGELLIKEYYRIGPMIVSNIDKESSSSSVYSMLWDSYISPCFAKISSGQLDEAKSVYVDMVKMLCERYGIDVDDVIKKTYNFNN